MMKLKLNKEQGLNKTRWSGFFFSKVFSLLNCKLNEGACSYYIKKIMSGKYSAGEVL